MSDAPENLSEEELVSFVDNRTAEEKIAHRLEMIELRLAAIIESQARQYEKLEVIHEALSHVRDIARTRKGDAAGFRLAIFFGVALLVLYVGYRLVH